MVIASAGRARERARASSARSVRTETFGGSVARDARDVGRREGDARAREGKVGDRGYPRGARDGVAERFRAARGE